MLAPPRYRHRPYRPPETWNDADRALLARRAQARATADLNPHDLGLWLTYCQLDGKARRAGLIPDPPRPLTTPPVQNLQDLFGIVGNPHAAVAEAGPDPGWKTGPEYPEYLDRESPQNRPDGIPEGNTPGRRLLNN